MTRLVVNELRASLRRPQFIVLSILLIIVPPLSGVLSLSGYALDHWMSYFTIMFDWVALAFPLLVALLTQPQLLDEWSNTFAFLTRPRVRPGRYFTSKVISSGLLAGMVFFFMTAACFVVARTTFTNQGRDVPLAGPIAQRFSFSQLWEISPLLYAGVYCLWVMLVAALVGAWCTLCTALIANKYVALVTPFILWNLLGFLLAVARLEAYGMPPFRFNIKQQPIWTEFVGLAILIVAILGLYQYVKRSNFLTPGIVRT